MTVPAQGYEDPGIRPAGNQATFGNPYPVLFISDREE
jgi:hypothetical protein